MIRSRAALLAYLLLLAPVLALPLTPRATQQGGAARPATADHPARPAGERMRGMVLDEEPGPGVRAYHRRHALVVGVTRYEGRFGNLAGPGFDAAEVAAVLASRYGFERVTLLVDAKPDPPPPDGVTVVVVPRISRAVFAERLAALRAEIDPADALLFYYAGHGLRAGPRGYLVPSDGDPERTTSLLDLADVVRALRVCDAHHTLMVLDCCFSGIALEPASGVDEAVGALEDRDDGLNLQGNLGRVFRRRAFQILTAGTGKEPVGDLVQLSSEYADLAKTVPEYQGHSPFTAVFLQALHGLRGLPDGRLLASDLGYYMSFTLVTDERVGARQAPKYGSFGRVDGDFLFLPTLKVLNPTLIAPLYLPGPQYAPLRQSACLALRQFILDQPVAERLPLTRSAVAHLGRLLQDKALGPRLAAAQVLADLATAYGSQAPEFAEVVKPLTAVLADRTQPQDLQRQAARALGQLGRYVDPESVKIFGEHVQQLEVGWKSYEKQVAIRLQIVPPEDFRLPEELQAEMDRIEVPPSPAANAFPAERLAHLEALRQRLDLLSPQALAKYEERHNARGKTLLGQARLLATNQDAMSARQTAAEALGFAGFGRPLGDQTFAERHPQLLMRATPEWREAEDLILGQPCYQLLWCSPTPKHHEQSVSCVAFASDGKTLASGSCDNTVKLWDMATGKEKITLKGHTDWVWSVAFTPDGKTLASGSKDNTIRLWDVASGKQTALLNGHTADVNGVSFSPDGRTLASASNDRTIRLWDVVSGQQTALLNGHIGDVNSVSFSPDGRTLASASDDRTIRLWDVASGQQTALLNGHTNVVLRVVFAPDGRTLASAGRDNTIRLWDVAGGKQIALLNGHTAAVHGVAFAPDGRTLASASEDETIRLWDVAGGQQTALLNGHTNVVFCVAFAPDGRTLASASGDQTILLWDMARGNQTAFLNGHTGGVFRVAFAQDGRTLASASWDKTIRLWDVASGQQTALLNGHIGNAVGYEDVSFSPDGRTSASASEDGTIRLWDVAGGKQTALLNGHTNKVTCVAFAPDGRTLASASWDKTIRLWDVASGKQTALLDGPTSLWEHLVNSLAFSPDGRTMALAGMDGKIQLWDLVSGNQTVLLSGHTGQVTSVAFAPDGRILASASWDKTVRLWDVASGKQTLLSGHTGQVTSVAFAPDGRTLASAGRDNTIRLWDVAAGKQIALLNGPAWVNSVAFAPDGRTLASAGNDHMIRLWDVASGKNSFLLGGRRGQVTSVAFAPVSVAFSPDGRSMISASGGGPVLWDVVSGQMTSQTIDGQNRGVTCLAFSPDGRSLATAGADGKVHLEDRASHQETELLHGRRVTSVAFAPDSHTLASADDKGTIRLWDAASGKQIALLSGHTDHVTSVAFAPDGRILASAGRDNTIRLWDVGGGQQIALLNGPAWVNSVVFAPDGRTLASAGEDGTIQLWDVASGKKISLLIGHGGPVTSVAFSPDGHTLTSASEDRTIRLWDVASGQQTGSTTDGQSGGVTCLVFSPDGRILATAGAGSIRLWDASIDSFNLAAYLPLYQFRGLDLQFQVPPLLDNLYASNEGMLAHVNIPRASHLGILRSNLPEPELNRALFEQYLRAQNLDSAEVMLQRLVSGPDRSLAEKRFAVALRQAALSTMNLKSFDLTQRRLRQAADLEPRNPENHYLGARLEVLRAAAQPGGLSEAAREKVFRQAIDLLEQAVREGLDDRQRLKMDEAWKTLQSDPGFQKLIEMP